MRNRLSILSTSELPPLIELQTPKSCCDHVLYERAVWLLAIGVPPEWTVLPGYSEAMPKGLTARRSSFGITTQMFCDW